jgi:Sap, sulfolipid-1-addressing protein
VLVLSAAVHLIPYAFLATLSPLGFAATITVMRTGRLKALGFALGVVLGQLLACSALVAAGAIATPDRSKAHPTVEALLELALAFVLLSYAAVVHRRPETRRRTSNGRSKAALERLQRVHVFTASGVGMLLGIGGPKRLVLTALASASIAAAGTTGSDEAALIVWYGLLATVLVWLPVLGYLLLGNRAVATLDAAVESLNRHRRRATVYILVVVSIALLVNAALLL